MPGVHGRFVWNELNTSNVEKAKAFYSEALGWEFVGQPMDMSVGTYWLIKCGDAGIGGMFELTGPHFQHVPDHWLPYIGVDDIDGRVAKATANGATILRAPFDVPGVGRIAIIRDPSGAVAGWMTPVTPPF